MPTREEALRQLQEELDAVVKKNRDRFLGSYAEELERLTGLSREDLAAITPGAPNAEVYAQLVAVVKTASETNLSEADLQRRIEGLGAVAVAMAKKAGVLAGMLT